MRQWVRPGWPAVGGSPAAHARRAGDTWPQPRAFRSRRWYIVYTATLLFSSVLPLLAAVPRLLVVYLFVRNADSLRGAALLILVSSPITVTLGLVTYGLITAALVRLLARLLPPGFHPGRRPGRVGGLVR